MRISSKGNNHGQIKSYLTLYFLTSFFFLALWL